MNRCVQVDPETAYLLPPSVDEWLPINHLARFVVDVMDQLDLSRLTGAYAGRGSAAHHPSVVLGLLVYGYATGVFSSRKIERATHDSVAFRYMAANTHPDDDTLATFRTRFLLELEDLFVQVLVAGADDEPGPAGPDRAGRQQGSGERVQAQGAVPRPYREDRRPVARGGPGVAGKGGGYGSGGVARWAGPADGRGAAGRPAAGAGGSQGQDGGTRPGAFRG